MPYLKLYSSDMTIQQKRTIAQRLTEITLRTLQLRAEQRRLITIQFLPIPEAAAQEGLTQINGRSEVALEVLGHNLTATKRKAFTREVTEVLPELVPAKSTWIGRLFHHEANTAKQVAVQFNEMGLEGSGTSFDQSERLAA